MSYFMVQRGWMDDPLYEREPFDRRSAMMWLIEHAAWEPTVISVDRVPVRLERGELSYSERFLAGQWMWSRGKVRRFLDDLTTWGKIKRRNTPVQKSAHQEDHPQSIITICDYVQNQDETESERPDAGPSLAHLWPISGPNNKERRKEGKKEGVRHLPSESYPESSHLQADTTRRGTRLPTNFTVPDEWKEEGRRIRDGCGLPPIDLTTEAERFVDYWHAKAGRDGTKLDWRATWRNWCRNAKALPVAGNSNGAAVPQYHTPRGPAPTLESFRVHDKLPH